MRAASRQHQSTAANAKARQRPPSVAGPFATALRCQQAGQLAEAERLCRGVLAHQPDHAQSHYLLGVIALQRGRFGEGYTLIARALPALDAVGEVHRNLAVALQGLGRLDEAVAAFHEALRRRPDHVACVNLGVLLQQRGDVAGAFAAYTQAVALQPGCAEAHNNLGILLQGAGRHDDAMAAYGRAVALRPDFAEAHVNAGIALQEEGHPAEARAAIERALAANPAHAHAWYLMSDLKTFTPGDPDVARLEALQDAPERPAEERSALAFALGKALMDIGAVGRAFVTLEVANRTKRATFAYAVADDTAQMARLAEEFDPGLMRRFAGAGAASDLPVFILGMPRSGTTLIEQILASHPAVAGGGELPALPDVIGRGLCRGGPQGLDEERFRSALRDMGEAYLRQVAPLGAGRLRMTDKAMSIFRYAGLIHLMLPGARLIHCRRDPLDTCFSCYTKNFAERQAFAYDLGELGAFYRAYAALMAHWRAVLPPECFLEVDYEAVIDDLEGEAVLRGTRPASAFIAPGGGCGPRASTRCASRSTLQASAGGGPTRTISGRCWRRSASRRSKLGG